MENEQIIKAWKNPELRGKHKDVPSHPSGKGFHELSMEDMMAITGAAEVHPQTTPSVSQILSVISRSSRACIGISVSAISGIVSYNKECLG
jgi:mersacidin/lichenicidin family type 2 lantibiotic